MEDIYKITSALNSLRKVNHKRLSRYEAATRHATGEEMKALFSSFAKQSKMFTTELERWLMPYAKRFKTLEQKPSLWERMREALGANPGGDLSIGDFEELEEEASQTYKNVLSTQIMPFTALQDIEKQALAIDKVRKTLREIKSHKGVEVS